MGTNVIHTWGIICLSIRNVMTTKIIHKAAQDFLVLLFEMKLMLSKDMFKVRLRWFGADLVKLFPLSCRMQRD